MKQIFGKTVDGTETVIYMPSQHPYFDIWLKNTDTKAVTAKIITPVKVDGVVENVVENTVDLAVGASDATQYAGLFAERQLVIETTGKVAVAIYAED